MAEIDIADVKTVRVHPAIGIGRVGDSDEYFTGPEIPGAPPEPSGDTLETKYKDAQGRLKRQAARFRCFGYDDQGGYVELTGKAEVTINWEVTLANKKAAAPEFPDGPRRNPGQSENDLVIAPGSRSIIGRKTNSPSAPVAFDDGRVRFTIDGAAHEIKNIYLGELRTDENGRLLVLGGRGLSQCHPKAEQEYLSAFNNDNWCDDVSDGPVKAEVTISVGGGERKFTATPGWVINTPPKFAPEADSPTTLWDQVMNFFGVQPPDRPSYVKDIFPVLQSARTIKAVNQGSDGHHGWRHPVIAETTRKRIFQKIGNPLQNGSGGGGSLMPKLVGLEKEYPSLTPRQYKIMQRWRDGAFDNDWKPEWGHDRPSYADVPITPEGLDHAALHACVGAAFLPGIEGGRFLIEKDEHGKPKNWREPYQALRFAEHVKAGDVTAKMALPWQADFWACGESWWPVPRPNQAVPKGTNAYKDWDRNVGSSGQMVHVWRQLGVVIRDASGTFVEVARSLAEPGRVQLTSVAFPATAAIAGPDPLWSDVGRLAADLADAAVLSFGQATTEPGRTQSWPLWLTEIDREIAVEIRSADLDRLEVRLGPPLGPSLGPGDFGVITSREYGRLELRIELPYHVEAGRYARQGLWRVDVRADAEVTYQLAATTTSLITFPAVMTATQDGSISALVDFTGAPISNGAAVVQPMAPRRELEAVALRSETAPMSDRVVGQVAVQQAPYLRVQVTGTSPMGHPFVRERLMRTDDLP
ncbi:hypothetical protein BZB76_2018 [Actinomadura pelletieri DSM 43383]|uniref:Uncharacterized protein n=1 Tax=Actinomadura pelletieri DSM 43383 TaxID=1120940 RepID=A0A495QTC3_9ACTN|nr:LodA/GoxA family CTQ-dependent oxidase [Actinomadura pelletieri]RKS76661.1 hypothetical protein BZB76_2018 [Actinomadura pelletieri DSM 43383]